MALRLGFVYAALFFELGVSLPFFPLWLRAQSLADDAIGILLAAPLLTRIVATPAVAALADRGGRMTSVMLACAVTVVVGTGLLALAGGFFPILILVIAIALAQGPLIALADAVTLGALKEAPAAELRYGRIRIWGSAGFAIASISAGWMLEWLPASSIIGMLFLSAIVTALAAITVALLPARRARPVPQMPSGGAAGTRLLILVVVGAALVQASHAAVYGFSTLHWQSRGLSGLLMGSLWATGIIAEIAFFLIAGFFVRGPRSASALLLAGAATATLRWVAMAADPDTVFLVLLQAMHGLSFGATHLGSVFLLAALAPGGRLAQAQAWLAAGWAGAMALLTTLAGYFHDSWGELIYLPMAVASAAGLLLLFPVALGLRGGKAPFGAHPTGKLARTNLG